MLTAPRLLLGGLLAILAPISAHPGTPELRLTATALPQVHPSPHPGAPIPRASLPRPRPTPQLAPRTPPRSPEPRHRARAETLLVAPPSLRDVPTASRHALRLHATPAPSASRSLTPTAQPPAPASHHARPRPRLSLSAAPLRAPRPETSPRNSTRRPSSVRPSRRAPQPAPRQQTGSTPDPRGCDGAPGWETRRGRTARERLDYPVESLGYELRFSPARKGQLARTNRHERVIELYVRSCARQSDALLVFTLAHEVAHALDFARPSTPRHEHWTEARNPGGSWWPRAGDRDDFGSGAGDFAEGFAQYHTGLAMNESRWAKRPTRAELHCLAPLFAPSYAGSDPGCA